MKIDPKEKLYEIISIIGEERVIQVYGITGCDKISFAYLYRIIVLDQIITHIHSGGSFKEIARHFGLSRMTVYRIFKQYVRKSQKD